MGRLIWIVENKKKFELSPLIIWTEISKNIFHWEKVKYIFNLHKSEKKNHFQPICKILHCTPYQKDLYVKLQN